MTFINNWNELLLAMVFISDPMKKTLPVTLTYFVGPYATNYVQMFAAIIIAIAPTVVVYSLFSNQIRRRSYHRCSKRMICSPKTHTRFTT